jgi:hypothetical protein
MDGLSFGRPRSGTAAERRVIACAARDGLPSSFGTGL